MKTGLRATRFPWFYFILAFGITWLIWSPGVLSTLGLIELPVPFMVFFFVGTWGPFLAASLAVYRIEGWDGVKKFWKRGLDYPVPRAWLLHAVLGAAWEVSPIVRPGAEGYHQDSTHDRLDVAEVRVVITTDEDVVRDPDGERRRLIRPGREAEPAPQAVEIEFRHVK